MKPKPKKPRQSGYYWVKVKRAYGWTIAKWINKPGDYRRPHWIVIDFLFPMNDSDLFCISSKTIPPPPAGHGKPKTRKK